MRWNILNQKKTKTIYLFPPFSKKNNMYLSVATGLQRLPSLPRGLACRNTSSYVLPLPAADRPGLAQFLEDMEGFCAVPSPLLFFVVVVIRYLQHFTTIIRNVPRWGGDTPTVKGPYLFSLSINVGCFDRLVKWLPVNWYRVYTYIYISYHVIAVICYHNT